MSRIKTRSIVISVAAVAVMASLTAYQVFAADNTYPVSSTATPNNVITGVSPFTDVPAGAPFHDDILWLYKQGITNGTVHPDGTRTFNPLESVTREAMAAFLYRFVGSPDFTPPTESPFTDVAVGAAFYKEISWLRSVGITTPVSFSPLGTVSREVMAVFIYRAAGSPEFTPPVESEFADVSPTDTFYKEITWLRSQGIANGTVRPDGTRTFNPTDLVSREATAAFIHRAAIAGLL